MADTPTPVGEVSRLPGVMQRKLAGLQAAEATTPPANTPPADTPPTPQPGSVAAPTPSVAAPAAPSGEGEGERVTLTRAELNELRAAAERARTADARAEAQADRNEELARRLTELEGAAKAVPVPAAPAAPIVEAEAFTPEELEAYAESESFIAKVVRKELAKILPAITEEIKAAKDTANNAATSLATQSSRNFFAEVKAKVPNLDAIIKHKHWGEFLDAVEPLSGATYQTLIHHNISNQRVEQLVNIYATFAAKYGVEQATQPTGYAGAVPSGGAVTPPLEQPKPAKLKISDRKKASEDYRKQRITWAQLEEVNKKFEEADKIGNVDYNA